MCETKMSLPVIFEKKGVENVTGLGTAFGYNINYEELWLQKFTKFKQKIQRWKHRDLSLQGKKLLINSYIMSSVSYLVNIYPCNIPASFITQTNELIRNFLWSGKTARVAHKTLALAKTDGGIELQDLEHFIECKKLRWIVKIHFSDFTRWNAFGKFYLHYFDNMFGMSNLLLQCTNLNGLDLERHLPLFYITCVKAWAVVQSKHIAVSKHDILEENIFGNINICKNKQSIFLANWTKSGIIKIKDIWDITEADWKSAEHIFETLKIKRNWIAEYYKIKDCIPANWKNVLKGEDVVELDTNLLQRHDLILSHENIIFKNKTIQLKKLKQKDLFFKCLYPHPPPSCKFYWENIFQENLNVKFMFAQLPNPLCNKKVSDFHWKTLHHAIYSEVRLKQMKRSDGKCKSCGKDETVCHMLFECDFINPVWNYIENFLTALCNEQFTITLKNVIFGMQENVIKDNTKRTIGNFFIMCSKWCIWKRRNSIRYENYERTSSQKITQDILLFCKNELSFLRCTKCFTKYPTILKSKLKEIIEFIA